MIPLSFSAISNSLIFVIPILPNNDTLGWQPTHPTPQKCQFLTKWEGEFGMRL